MKYFNSYKIFHGKNQFEYTVILILINSMLLAGTGIAVRVLESKEFQDFMTGAMPLICGAVAMTAGYVMINSVFSGTMRANPGYRFFHSISDGVGNFKRGLIAANVLSIIPIALYAAIGGVLYRHYCVVVMTVVCFAMLGLLNLTGHMNMPWIRIGMFCIIGFAYGFYAGFTEDESEGLAELPLNVTVIVCVVTLVFYIASIIVVTMRSEKLWNREG